jgi:homoserine trans-succinylase
VCERRKLLVNIAKSKVKRVTKRENVGEIYITFNGIRKEEFDCFRYL